jgi:hypothetical protein
MNKNQRFMEDIVCAYHPEFIASEDLRKYGIKHADLFNIERLIEETLAAVGGYTFLDQDGYDFSDLSDSKTVSVVNNSSTKNRKVIIISNVETKIGSLRVTIYNPFNDSIDYMFIPKSSVEWLMENDGTKGRASGIKQRIRTTWSENRDHYNKLERYRLNSFLELATKF